MKKRAKKRANGEGSIYQRADGRWTASVSLDHGKRKAFYSRDRQEVAHKLTAALKAKDDGLPLLSERQTVEGFLREWLESAKSSLRPRTWERYEQYVRLHIIPEIGRISLAKLEPKHLVQLRESRLKAGSSPATVAHLHAVLHKALAEAMRWGLVARNVADLVDPPRIVRKEILTLSPAQVKTLFVAAQDNRLEALYILAITTGMRQGELLALHWRDVNLKESSLQVRGTLQVRGKSDATRGGLSVAEPKTRGSQRQITLARAAVEALQRHRDRQNEERLRLEEYWEDHDLVFPNSIGKPIEATSLLKRSFHPLLKKAGLPRIRFHDLRHTAATLLLGANLNPKIVAEMLGHSQVGMTLDIYSHVIPTMQQQAADAMDRLLDS